MIMIRRELPPSRCVRGVLAVVAHSSDEDSPCRCPASRALTSQVHASLVGRCLAEPADVPNEACQLAGDGDDRLLPRLASGHQLAELAS